MVPLSVLAIQLGMVTQQIAALTEQIRLHHALHHGANAIQLDVARMQLVDANQRVGIAAEQVRRVGDRIHTAIAEAFLRVRVEPAPPAPTMTPNEVLRQVEARA